MPLNGFTYPTTGAAFTNNSSKTFGLRADGGHKVNADWKVLYTAEYAKQDDYRGGDSRIDAHYWRLGAGAAQQLRGLGAAGRHRRVAGLHRLLPDQVRQGRARADDARPGADLRLGGVLHPVRTGWHLAESVRRP